MSCSVFVHIKYSKELEEKIKNMPGIILESCHYGDFESLRVPEGLFVQHKKEVDAHRFVVENEGVVRHFPENLGKWEYLSHGFDIWLNFEGDIVFVAPCHWDTDHGHWTILDLKEWIKSNLGDIKITQEKVSY